MHFVYVQNNNHPNSQTWWVFNQPIQSTYCFRAHNLSGIGLSSSTTNIYIYIYLVRECRVCSTKNISTLSHFNSFATSILVFSKMKVILLHFYYQFKNISTFRILLHKTWCCCLPNFDMYKKEKKEKS